MRLPLFKSDIKKLSDTGNAGLWFNKFCNQWQTDEWSLKSFTVGRGKNKKEFNPKQDWIKTVSKKTGESPLLQEAVNRCQEMIDNLCGIHLVCKTVTPFVTGLGNPHPVENGFTWHHLFGTPYLPASSIKGLVRDWAENWADEKNPDDIIRIFGPESEDNKKGIGSVIFLDAIPVKPVQLKTEIITPHYGDYYQSTEDDLVVPGDWLSPKPIPFLAVAEGGEFQFSLIARSKNADKNDLELVTGWLLEALKTLGAGGKTAVGYGIMTETSESIRKRNDKATEQERINIKETERKRIINEGEETGFKGIALEIFLLATEENWKHNNAAMYSGAEQLIPAVSQEENQEIRSQAAKLLADKLEGFKKNKGVMANPDKVSGKMKKPAYKKRVSKIAKALREILKK